MDSLPPGVDPSQVPAGVPPPGVTPNLVNSPSMSWVPRLAIYTTFPAMVLVFALRIYTRLCVTQQVGMDDYICALAVVTVASFVGILMPIVLDDVLGRHLWEVPLSAVTDEYLKGLHITGILYNVGAMFCKLALLVLYHRIFRPLRRANVLIWLGVTVVVVFYVICSVLNIVYCIPRSGDGGWSSMKTLERCDTHQQKLNFAQGIVSTITDFYVLAIPLTMVMELRLSNKRKFGVAGIFLTGLMACSFSLAGTVYRYKAATADPSDATWLGCSIQALGLAELNIGIICSCMPIIFILFKQAAQRAQTAWKSFSELFSTYPRTSGQGTTTAYTRAAGEFSPNVLTNVPKETRTGISSFIRGGSRINGETPKRTGIQVDTYFELQSVDYEYHNHVQGRPSNPSHRSSGQGTI